MITTENIGWIALILVLLVAVGAVIMQPIYDKAVEAKEEIEDFNFEAPTSLNVIESEYVAVLEGENDYNRKNILVTHMAYTV